MAFHFENVSLSTLWNSLGLQPPKNLQFPLKGAEGKGYFLKPHNSGW